MKKISFKILSIVVFVSIILLIVLFYLIERPKVEVTDADKERIKFVKETALAYGMGNAIETTQDTLKESNKNTNNIVSFGKKQIYELLLDIGGKKENFTLIYQKFESSKAGKKEAVKLFEAFKDSIKNLPNSGYFTESINTETGDKTFTAKLMTSDTETETEISIVLIYDAEKYEVAQNSHLVELPGENVYALTDKILIDMGWNKGTD